MKIIQLNSNGISATSLNQMLLNIEKSKDFIISLSGFNIENSILEIILKHCKSPAGNLYGMIFSDCKISFEAAKEIILNSKNLVTIDFTNCLNSQEEVSQLIEIAEKNPNLLYVNQQAVRKNHVAAYDNIDSYLQNEKIDNSIEKATIFMVDKFYKNLSPQAVKEYFEKQINLFTDAQGKMVNLFAKLENGESITIKNRRLSSDQQNQMAIFFLSHKINSPTIEFSNCHLKDQALNGLQLGQLTSLNLERNDLTDKQKHIANAVQNSRHLRLLNLSNNKINAKNAKPLIEAIVQSNSLEFLNLSNNPIGLQAVKQILAHVPNSCLSHLSLGGTILDGEDAQEIMNFLSDCKQLICLDIDDLGLSPQVMKSIKDSLPNLQYFGKKKLQDGSYLLNLQNENRREHIYYAQKIIDFFASRKEDRENIVELRDLILIKKVRFGVAQALKDLNVNNFIFHSFANNFLNDENFLKLYLSTKYQIDIEQNSISIDIKDSIRIDELQLTYKFFPNICGVTINGDFSKNVKNFQKFCDFLQNKKTLYIAITESEINKDCLKILQKLYSSQNQKPIFFLSSSDENPRLTNQMTAIASLSFQEGVKINICGTLSSKTMQEIINVAAKHEIASLKLIGKIESKNYNFKSQLKHLEKFVSEVETEIEISRDSFVKAATLQKRPCQSQSL